MTDRELMQMALDALEDVGDEWGFTSQRTLPKRMNVIEALRARLAQPEPEPVAKMREMLKVQGQNGTWNYDPYFHGMYNGMEFMLAMVEDREPVFRSSPGEWLGYTAPPQREWQDLTDDESDEIWGECLGVFDCLKMTQAKLKEKNT